jgi:hypothetical protein
MFDFIFKPEISAMKNVLIAYDSYSQSISLGRKGGGIPFSMMGEFASWYFKQRLGFPLIINPVRSQNMITIAEATTRRIAEQNHGGQITVYAVLLGLLTAENIRTDKIDFVALRNLANKGVRRLPPEILGF